MSFRIAQCECLFPKSMGNNLKSHQILLLKYNIKVKIQAGHACKDFFFWEGKALSIFWCVCVCTCTYTHIFSSQESTLNRWVMISSLWLRITYADTFQCDNYDGIGSMFFWDKIHSQRNLHSVSQSHTCQKQINILTVQAPWQYSSLDTSDLLIKSGLLLLMFLKTYCRGHVWGLCDTHSMCHRLPVQIVQD